MPSGIVLTGGSAKMEGAIELAEEVFHVPVRLGLPQYIRGLSDVVRNPIYSTGAGPAAVRARQLARRQSRTVDHGQRPHDARAHEELVSGASLSGHAAKKHHSECSKIEADRLSIN